MATGSTPCMHCAALQGVLLEKEAELASMREEHEEMGAQLQGVCAGEHNLKEENLGLAAAIEAAQQRIAAAQAEADVLQQENLELCMAAAAHSCELAAAQEAAAKQLAAVQEAAAAQLAEALEVRWPQRIVPLRTSNYGNMLIVVPGNC